jgi:hypothetical protein
VLPPIPTEEDLMNNQFYNAAKAKAKYETARRDRLSARLEPAAEKSNALLSAVRNCEQYLRELPASAVLDDYEVAPKKSDTLESVQAKQAKLSASIKDRRRRPCTAAEAKQIVSEQMAALRKRGTPNLLGTFHHREDMRIGRMMVQHADGTPTYTYVDDVLGLAAWALGDVIEAKLHDEIELRCNHDQAMTNEARAAALTKAEAELLELERIEATLTDISRADMSPLAILGITTKGTSR